MTVSPFVAQFIGMMSDTVTITPGFVDAYGQFIPSGALITVPCRIEGQSRLVRDRAGQEVVSTFQIYTGGFNSLTVDRHRYTLPAGYSTRTLIEAIGVDPQNDENGPCYEAIYLP